MSGQRVRFHTFSGKNEALLGSFTIDMAVQMVLHASTMWIPLIGLAISAARLWRREKTLRDEFVGKVEEGLRNVLRRLTTTEGARLRETVKQSFIQLRDQVGTRIDAEISSIDATLQTVLAKKQDHEYSAEQEQSFLRSTQGKLRAVLTKARRLLVG